MPDDYSSTTQTTGAVAVGGSATGDIETSQDFDWFAVDLVAGHTYVIGLEGTDSGGGALQDPVLRGLYDADGNRIAGTRDNDGGAGRDARLTFTATTTGTYYIEARGHSNHTGDYTVRVTEWVDTDAERGGATDLGDITAVETQFPAASLDGSSDSVDYWRFTLSEARRVGLGLRRQDANADLFLEDAEGNVLYSSTEEGTASEWISQTLLAGTYFVRVEAQEEGANEFKLRYGVSAANPAAVAALEQQQEGTDEAPAFAQPSYAFDLAENADGGAIGVALGAVSATDPEDAAVSYSIEAGDSGGLFAIDPGTGALSYEGAGEDYESGTTSYELTVRASDGGLHSDVTVAVNVTDVAEAPAFSSGSYAFSLAENADGGAIRVALGAVSATDPENATLTYSIEAGDSGGLFAIDSETGALSYQGAGEDYESGTTSYELTVRASDGTNATDTIVTVNVTDLQEPEEVEPLVTQSEQSTSQTVSEPAGEDFAANISTAGRIAVGDTATGKIGSTGDRDGFAVELVAGRTYIIDLRGSPTGDGTLNDPYLRGIKGPDGSRIAGVSNDDGGEGYNSQLNFTPTESGTHYIIAGAYSGLGTYEVEVRDVSPQTAQQETVNGPPAFGQTSYEFTLAENADGGANGVSLGAVSAADPEDSTITYSIEAGDSGGLFAIDSGTGALSYQGAGEDYESGAMSYELTVRASDGGLHSDVTVAVNVTDVPEAPAFGQENYTFSLTENAGGNTIRLSLGRVSAADPEGVAVEYSLVAGNGAGLFELDAQTGDLFYVGSGEDYESGSTRFELTVRASDGNLFADATMTVNVTDVQEAPAFGQENYTFSLTENAGGDTIRLSLGRVSAADPEGVAVEYSLVAGNGAGLFELDAQTGDLFYVGSGEDYESGSTRFELTVRASDGNLFSDATMTIDVTDVPELEPIEQQSVSEPDGQDLPEGVSTTGRVAVGGSATGEIETGGDRDWFAVDLKAGRTYRIDLEGLETGAGTLYFPALRGIYNANGYYFPGTTNDTGGGVGHNSRLFVMAGQDATYYVAAGSYETYRGTYTLSVMDVTDGVPDDFEDGIGTSGSVEVGGSAMGVIDGIEAGGDRDWFAVELKAGRLYQIDLEGRHTGAGTVREPYLFGVHDANGNYIANTTDQGSGEGTNSRVFFTPQEDGTYYVAARAFGDGEGTYTLSVTDATDSGLDDFTADTGTSGTVAMDGSATGEIDYAHDRDWFAVELEAGRIYRIDLKGSEAGDGTLENPYLRGIFDANGNLLPGTTNDNAGVGYNSRVFFTAEDAGAYYVAAGDYYNRRGTYTLSIKDVTTDVPDDFEAGTGTSGSVAVGGSATGDIEFLGDHDWFAVTLEAGATYRIDLKGSWTGDGTLSDLYLYGVYDADGNYFDNTTNDDGGAHANSRVEFTAEDAGAYYVAAGAYGSGKGTYTLSVVDITDGVPDDFSAGTGTSGAVAVGGSATGEIDFYSDRDWFAVTLEAGATYRIDLEGSQTGRGTLYDPVLRGIHDANGDFISGTWDDDSGAGRNSRVFFKAKEDATYYVAAGTDGDGEGAYTLSVTEIPDDFAAGTDTTGAVEVGGSATGEIDFLGDRDWFAVELKAGRTYWIDLKGSEHGDGTLVKSYLFGLHDADGNRLPGTRDDDTGAGANSRVEFTAEEDATYYVAAGAWFDWGVGTYTLSVRDVTDGIPDDFEAGTGTSGTVEVDGSATGEIEFGGDRDWFAVTLEAGKVYRVDLDGSWTGHGNLWDPYLRGVHDANGVLIPGTTNDNDGEGTNSRVYFTAEDAGAYYVAAGAYGDGQGTYTLSMMDVTDTFTDDFSDGIGTSGSVEVGGSATGEIEIESDRDWFAVTLEAGKGYEIDLEGWWTGAGTLRDPYLFGVHDANGGLITGTRNDDGGEGRNSRVKFTAEEAATYYVATGAYGDGQGTYRLSVREIPDDFSAGTGTTGAVDVGGSATGEIEFNRDRDWFAVELEANTNYRIDLEGSRTGAGTLRDPYLRGVHDANGVRLPGTTNDNGGVARNSRVEFTVDDAGAYYVAAGAYKSGQGAYRLSVREVPDDFSAGTGTTGTVDVGGSATGEIEFHRDRDWFAVELEANTTYRIDLEGYWTGAGTLRDPYLRGVHDADGNLLPGTTADDGGTDWNSRMEFTADDAGTYYVAAGAGGTWEGAYTLSVSVEEVM